VASKKKLPSHWHSIAVRGGRRPHLYQGLVNPPIYHGSTVLFESLALLEEARRNPFGRTFYGRMGTPTIFALEEGVACLYGEDKKGVATCSGLSAIACVLLAYVRAGDTILVADNVYEPTRRFCKTYLTQFGVKTIFYPPTAGDDIVASMDDHVRLIFMESPGSLTFEVQDVPTITSIARARNIMTVIDNTWAGALYFNPFEHGVDITIEAATKYITGHADAMLGVVICNPCDFKRIKSAVVAFGNAPGPDACYFGQRGLRSLAVRMPQHEENALTLASWLKAHPDVRLVLHPALDSCPGHALWQRDFSGSSGLFAFTLEDRGKKALASMVDGMTFFGLGYSWGGYESLIMPSDAHKERRFPPAFVGQDVLIRLHAGLESVDDLLADLERGLQRYRATS